MTHMSYWQPSVPDGTQESGAVFHTYTHHHLTLGSEFMVTSFPMLALKLLNAADYVSKV